MSDIHNNFSGANITFEAGSTQSGDVNVNLHDSTINQTGTTSADADKAAGAPSGNKLSKRQLAHLFTALLNIDIDPVHKKQVALANLLSRVSGYSEEGLRQTIMEMAKGKTNSNEADDLRLVAELLRPLDLQKAEKLQNDAESLTK